MLSVVLAVGTLGSFAMAIATQDEPAKAASQEPVDSLRAPIPYMARREAEAEARARDAEGSLVPLVEAARAGDDRPAETDAAESSESMSSERAPADGVARTPRLSEPPTDN